MRLKIEDKLRKKGLTVKQFADAIFTTERNVYRWKRGRSLPDLEVAYNMSKLLDCSIDELVQP